MGSADLIVAYYRVSTAKQNVSGLGLEAQRAAVHAYVARTHATLVAEFTEVESGRKADRPQFAAARDAAREAGGALVIAKFDRLARDVGFLLALLNGDVPFLALDLPGATRTTLLVLMSVAEAEAIAAGDRTRAALAAAKARGTKIGTPANLTDVSRQRSVEVRQAKARERHRLVLPLVLAWSQQGWPLQRMADELTALKIPRARASDRLRLGERPPKHATRWTTGPVWRLLELARRVHANTPPPVPPKKPGRPPRPQTPRVIAPRAVDHVEAVGDLALAPVAAPDDRVMASWISSRCRRCRKWIGPSMTIRYSKTVGARHLDEAACAAALPDAPREPFDGDAGAEIAAVGRLLDAAPWTFAKTMPDQPHFYTLRKQWADPEAFTRAVLRIRQLGVRRRYRSMTNLKLDVNGHSYWVMDEDRCPAALVVLINRAERDCAGRG